VVWCAPGGQQLGQLRNGAGIEHRTRGQPDPESRAHACQHLGAQDRVAAEADEAVVEPDPLQTKYISPDPGQDLFGIGSRRHLFGARNDRGRLGQCPPIQLPVGTQRQPVQHHERGRNHVLGQNPGSQLGVTGDLAGRDGHCPTVHMDGELGGWNTMPSHQTDERFSQLLNFDGRHDCEPSPALGRFPHTNGRQRATRD
jgi:hypothetical protein